MSIIDAHRNATGTKYLEGYIALGTSIGGHRIPPSVVAPPYSATVSDAHLITTAAGTVTLPSDTPDGHVVWVYSAGGDVTLNVAAGGTINNNVSELVSAENATMCMRIKVGQWVTYSRTDSGGLNVATTNSAQLISNSDTVVSNTPHGRITMFTSIVAGGANSFKVTSSAIRGNSMVIVSSNVDTAGGYPVVGNVTNIIGGGSFVINVTNTDPLNATTGPPDVHYWIVNVQ